MGFGGINRYHLINQLSGNHNQEPKPLSGRESFIGTSPSPFLLPPYLPPVNRFDLLAALAPKKSAVHQAFKECLSNIELDQSRIDQASQHYNAIKDWLESRLPGVQVRRVGSFKKHTKIRPITVNGVASPIDIDAIVCFGDARQVSNSGRSADSCLQQVRNALIQNRKYKMLEPDIDHPVVTLSYASEFYIELIPCFRNKLDFESLLRDPASYLVCNSKNDWEHADYDYDSAYITAANKQAGQQLIPAIKLVKQFVRNSRLDLKSFQVELLCVRILLPKLQELKQANQTWEWQELFTYLLQNARFVLNQDLSLPGSRTKAPPIVNPVSLGADMKAWGDIFATLCLLPPTTATLQAFKAYYGERFPTP